MPLFAELDAKSQPARGGLWFSYRMRWKRRRLLARALARRQELSRISVNEAAISSSGILAFMTLRNEACRLPHFLDHYRALGVDHFLVVDNGSTDGSVDLLRDEPDVSVWQTKTSYKAARFGVDWLTCLQFKFAHNKWSLTVDADELLVLPGDQALAPLVAHLDDMNISSFGALMLDMYPKGSLSEVRYVAGDNPIAALPWFDSSGYRGKRHPIFDNLWIQGGVRERVFFVDEPDRSPTLNKTPLVKWNRRFAYVTSTHQMLPRRLNRVFEAGRPTGVLLHTKFLPEIVNKSAEELQRREHFENSDLYEVYHRRLVEGPDLWHAGSVRYEGPQQLEDLGLMSKGSWR